MVEGTRIVIVSLLTLLIGFLFGTKVPNGTFDFNTNKDSPILFNNGQVVNGQAAATTTKIATPTMKIATPVVKPTASKTTVKATTTATTTVAKIGTNRVNGVPTVGNCQIFPASHPYNTDISGYPIHPKSDHYVTTIDQMTDRHFLHPDFGGKGQYGMPINIVGKETPLVPVTFTLYGSESDAGPYRLPPSARVQPNDDRHLVVLDKDNCKLYELFYAFKNGDNSWNAGSGAIWDLSIIHRRPLFYTSADGAGMAIYPLVIKYDEVAQGQVNHAIRMTVPKTYRGFIWPANHYAGTTDPNLPPMGLRFRLKADYDISHLPYQAKVIATALKKYGTIIAQNGSAWVIGGEQDARWDDTQLRALKSIPGSAFEVVYTGEIITRQ